MRPPLAAFRTPSFTCQHVHCMAHLKSSLPLGTGACAARTRLPHALPGLGCRMRCPDNVGAPVDL